MSTITTIDGTEILLAFFQQPAGKYPPQTTKTWAVTP
jgi:hypothetical protein